jgi:hypothetical protein
VLLVVAWVALLALADLVSTRLYFGHLQQHCRLEETRLKAELERMKDEGRRMKNEGQKMNHEK